MEQLIRRKTQVRIKKEFEFKETMQQGENIIVIKAYNKSGLVQEFAGKTTYQP